MSVAAVRHGVASELTKLLTLRSVWITLLAVVVSTIGLSAVTASGTAQSIAQVGVGIDPGASLATVGLEMVGMGQIGLIVLGVMAAGSEWTSGQLATSLIAVPSRLRLAATKSLALLAITVPLSMLTIPAMSLAAQSQMGDLGVIDDGVPRSLMGLWAGGVVFWVALAQIALALGLLLRQVLAPLIVLIVATATLPLQAMVAPLSRFLPLVAGVQLYDPTSMTAEYPDLTLTTTAAATVVVGWTVVLLAISFISFRLRAVRR